MADAGLLLLLVGISGMWAYSRIPRDPVWSPGVAIPSWDRKNAGRLESFLLPQRSTGIPEPHLGFYAVLTSDEASMS